MESVPTTDTKELMKKRSALYVRAETLRRKECAVHRPKPAKKEVLGVPRLGAPIRRYVDELPWHSHPEDPNEQVRMVVIYCRRATGVPDFWCLERKDGGDGEVEIFRMGRKGYTWPAVTTASVGAAERALEIIDTGPLV